MANKPQQLRIIAGRWRGRKLPILDEASLRPTGDRIRETVFNWLAPSIAGAHCLDLFAGSGALGFEALSRGAANAVMIDASQTVCSQLKKNADTLKADNAEIICASIPNLSPQFKQQFDIVFLDPPFRKNFLPQCYTWLIENDLLAANALIYIECEKELNDLQLPNGWRLLKQKQSGQVGYQLVGCD